MPSGVYRLKHAKEAARLGTNPRRFDNRDSVTPESIRPTQYQNDTCVQNAGLAPKKERPKNISKKTSPPTSYARDGMEGPRRGRQPDKKK